MGNFFVFALSSMPALLPAKRDPIPFSFTLSYHSGPFDEEGKMGGKFEIKYNFNGVFHMRIYAYLHNFIA
jgi:hypothetical protein